MREKIVPIVLSVTCVLATSRALALPQDGILPAGVARTSLLLSSSASERESVVAPASGPTAERWRLPDPVSLLIVGVTLIGAAAVLRRAASDT